MPTAFDQQQPFSSLEEVVYFSRMERFKAMQVNLIDEGCKSDL